MSTSAASRKLSSTGLVESRVLGSIEIGFFEPDATSLASEVPGKFGKSSISNSSLLDDARMLLALCSGEDKCRLKCRNSSVSYLQTWQK